MAEAKGRRAAADFVSKIVKDPKQPPNTLLLKGYLGDSSEDGYTRLYLDPQLSDYVEIPDDAILHTQDIPRSDQSPLGGSYVWIQRDAEVLHGRVGSDRLKARFLEGRIYQEYMKGAQFGGGAGPFPPTLSWQCQTQPPQCPESAIPPRCPTDPGICPPKSHPIVVCPSQVCEVDTAAIRCHTLFWPPCIPNTVVLPQCQPSVFFPQCQPPTLPQQCQVLTAFPQQCQPQTLARCPSAVDACPSIWGCNFPGGLPGGRFR